MIDLTKLIKFILYNLSTTTYNNTEFCHMNLVDVVIFLKVCGYTN